MNRPFKIQAFSILELAVVLSLTGLFISIFFLSVNSFNRSMQQEIVIKNELNNFFLFRSNFWQDMEKSDSFRLQKDHLTCFSGSDSIIYNKIDEHLSRSHKNHQTSFELIAHSIEKTMLNGHEVIVFNLEWKNRLFSLKYPFQKQNRNEINAYFNQNLWKK